MNRLEKNYLFLVLLHVAIGFVIYIIPAFSKLYGLLMVGLGLYWVLKNRNRNQEVLFVAAYIVGSEVFLRMTGGNLLYEFSKYGVMVFIVLGMYFSGFSRMAIPYWIYMALLVPGIILATYVLDYDTDIRKVISFNLSGPLCLGLSALYTYSRRISLQHFSTIMLMIGLPIVACATYLFLYTPNIRDVITGTGSNFETSGGFGPNQVSTMLGLGMFIFFSRMLLSSPTKILALINVVLAIIVGYRGLVTFSRGGMITGVVMLIILVWITYMRVNSRGKFKMMYLTAFVLGGMALVWAYTAMETGGMIEKRYANQDAMGRVKESRLTGREDISKSEIAAFLDNPVFGIGLGKGMEIREAQTGKTVLSHNEVTRLLGEHGAFGVIILLILLGTPLVLYLDNKYHIYLLCCLMFWLLTINHAAMRLAAPAFVYSLALLKILPYERSVSR